MRAILFNFLAGTALALLIAAMLAEAARSALRKGE